MYQNGGRSGNSAIRKAESIIFTVVRTANRKCVFQEEEDGSVSTARNAGLILSRKVNKRLYYKTGCMEAGLFLRFYSAFLYVQSDRFT